MKQSNVRSRLHKNNLNNSSSRKPDEKERRAGKRKEKNEAEAEWNDRNPWLSEITSGSHRPHPRRRKVHALKAWVLRHRFSGALKYSGCVINFAPVRYPIHRFAILPWIPISWNLTLFPATHFAVLSFVPVRLFRSWCRLVHVTLPWEKYDPIWRSRQCSPLSPYLVCNPITSVRKNSARKSGIRFRRSLRGNAKSENVRVH